MQHRIPIPTFLAVPGGLFAFEFAVLAISPVSRGTWLLENTLGGRGRHAASGNQTSIASPKPVGWTVSASPATNRKPLEHSMFQGIFSRPS